MATLRLFISLRIGECARAVEFCRSTCPGPGPMFENCAALFAHVDHLQKLREGRGISLPLQFHHAFSIIKDCDGR